MTQPLLEGGSSIFPDGLRIAAICDTDSRTDLASEYQFAFDLPFSSQFTQIGQENVHEYEVITIRNRQQYL